MTVMTNHIQPTTSKAFRRLRQSVVGALLSGCVLMLTVCCTASDSSNSSESAVAVPLTFGVSVGEAATRAGSTGIINNPVLALSDYSFGVFAYGISAGNWTNKQLSYIGTTPASDLDDLHLHAGNWSYGTPIDWADQTISFLAYAPYVSAGSGDTGITGVSGSDVDNTTVSYTIGTKPSQCVDLLWGIRETTALPWLNATASQTGGPVTISFHHALAAIGFHVQTMVDMANDLQNLGDESAVADLLKAGGKYMVTVQDLTLEPVSPATLTKSKTLNLNSTTDANSQPVPRWASPVGTVAQLTVPNDEIDARFRHPADKTTAELLSLYDASAFPGVTQSAQQLLIAAHATHGHEQCFFVFPDATPSDYKLTLNWVITGETPNAIKVQYTRSSEVTVRNLQLKAGIKYYLNFVIGLKTVRLSVSAEDWTGNHQAVSADIEHGTSANSSLAPRRYVKLEN